MSDGQNPKVVVKNGDICVSLPITAPTGKVRVKRRSHFAEYGIPVASRTVELSSNDYLEWQIGYDLLVSDENRAKTSLAEFTFLNNKVKPERKFPYELSEILYHSSKKGFVSKNEIKTLFDSVSSLSAEKLLDVNKEMLISRTNPIDKEINSVSFQAMEVRYPLIVHRFGKYETYIEVINREKQKGVGNQPMLFLCLPLASLRFENDRSPFGRTADTKEMAKWPITETEAKLALELFHIFGMLSARHQYDVKEILNVMFADLSFEVGR